MEPGERAVPSPLAVADAALVTLGERLPESLVMTMAAELPQDAADLLEDTVVLGGAGAGEPFTAEEFVLRVATRAQVSVGCAAHMVAHVDEIIADEVSPEILRRVRAALPPGLLSA